MSRYAGTAGRRESGFDKIGPIMETVLLPEAHD
jgi:hypothetical protein